MSELKKGKSSAGNSSIFGEVAVGQKEIFATIAYVDESAAKVSSEHRAEFISVKSSIEQVSMGLSRLEQKVDAQSKQVDERFKEVDERFRQVDERFNRVDEQFKALDKKIDVSVGDLAARVNLEFLNFDKKLEAGFARQEANLTALVEALDAKSEARLQEMYTRMDAKYHDSRILAEEQNSRSLLLLEKLGMMTDSHVQLERRVSTLELR